MGGKTENTQKPMTEEYEKKAEKHASLMLIICSIALLPYLLIEMI